MDLAAVAWDPWLAEAFGVPLAALPEIRPSSAHFGETVALGALPAGVPVGSLVGDSHAALFGQAGFEPGAIKATYGTGIVADDAHAHDAHLRCRPGRHRGLGPGHDHLCA